MKMWYNQIQIHKLQLLLTMILFIQMLVNIKQNEVDLKKFLNL